MDVTSLLELCNKLDKSKRYKEANELENLIIKKYSSIRTSQAKIKLKPQELQEIKNAKSVDEKMSIIERFKNFFFGKPKEEATPVSKNEPKKPEPINPRPAVLKFDGVMGSGIQKGSFEEWKAFLESPGVEGGFSDYGKHIDPGGRTNLGITQDNMDEYTKRHKMRRIDVKTLNTNSPVYIEILKEYWNAVKADGLPKHTAAAIADFTFNSSRVNAIKEIQKELIRHGQTQVKITGTLDDRYDKGVTKQAIWNLVKHDPYKDFLLARQIGKARLDYVYNLQYLKDKDKGEYVMKNGKREFNPNMKSVVKKNMQGWFNRIQKLVNADPYNINVKHEFDPTKYGLPRPPVKKKSKLKIEVPDKPQFKPKPFTV